MQRLLLPLALLLLLPACSSSDLWGSFQISTDPPTLWLENRLNKDVRYVVVEEGKAALGNLDLNPSSWPALPSGEARGIPYEEIDGYSEGDTHAVVFWSAGEGVQQSRVTL